ncbi:MAG TPA: PAAR domain-containing protein [Paraburkholderia sp.]
MRIPVARDQDSTTTGGRVIALKASIHDNGKKIALRGEHATCGNCKGTWEMYGTGDKIRNRGTPVVVDDDRVLCPCEKNRVIAGADAKYFIHKTADTARAAVAGSTREAAQTATYDEQFTLLDEARRALSNVRYRIVTDSGQVFTGTTNAAGQTQRVLAGGSSTLNLQLET